MAKNAVQDGRVLDHVLVADCASGDVVVKGTLVGIAITGGKAGDTVAVATTGVWTLPKLEAADIADGASVIWDVSAKQVIVTGAATGDVSGFGVAAAPAGSGTTTVDVLLTPGAGVVSGA